MVATETFNYKKAEEDFMNNILPVVQNHYERDGVPDIPARRWAWNNYLDSLSSGGIVPEDVLADWEHPHCVCLDRL